MNRPSLSNTVVMKAGPISVKIGVLQTDGSTSTYPDPTPGATGEITGLSRAFGEGIVEWYVAESSFSGAASLVCGVAAGISLVSSALLF